MNKVANYSRRIKKAMTPELKYRIEKIALFQKKTFRQVVNDFLKAGANTPSIFGIGC